MEGVVGAVDDKIIVDESFLLNLAGIEVVVAFDEGPFAVENVDGVMASASLLFAANCVMFLMLYDFSCFGELCGL